MPVPSASKVTPEEYLAAERAAAWRSEYVAGEVVAMSGGSLRHNLVAGNVLASLHGQLRHRPCWVAGSDMRVKVSETGLFTYPDVVAVCGEARFDDGERDTLLNPTLIVEVLSRTTEAYDRGEKFAHYRRIESLAEYVLVSQKRVLVERFSRQSDGSWNLEAFEDLGGEVALPSIGGFLRLAEVYEKVDLP